MCHPATLPSPLSAAYTNAPEGAIVRPDGADVAVPASNGLFVNGSRLALTESIEYPAIFPVPDSATYRKRPSGVTGMPSGAVRAPTSSEYGEPASDPSELIAKR